MRLDHSLICLVQLEIHNVNSCSQNMQRDVQVRGSDGFFFLSGLRQLVQQYTPNLSLWFSVGLHMWGCLFHLIIGNALFQPKHEKQEDYRLLITTPTFSSKFIFVPPYSGSKTLSPTLTLTSILWLF